MTNIAIIGVGNLLMGDEGAGVHAINYLQQFEWPKNVELIDAGVPGAKLLHLIEGRDLSIIIDCADFKGSPGDVIAIDYNKIKKRDHTTISLHRQSLDGTLLLAEKTGIKTGKIILICVQPESMMMTDKLTPPVENTLPKIKKLVEKLI